MGLFQTLGKAFGLTKDKNQGDAPAARPLVTPLETDYGKYYEKLLKDRIAGIGTGYTPEFISQSTSPFAVAQRRGLREETIPTISAQATARGLGRSTIPVGQIGRESNITEQNIAERIANLGVQSENLKASQVSEATGRYGNLTELETSSENQKRSAANAFDAAEFLRQRGYREAADRYQTEALKKTAEFAGKAVMTVATGGFNPATTSGGVTTPASFDWGQGFKALGSQGATVKIAGQDNQMDNEDMDKLLSALGLSDTMGRK
jgi:hypothetical protein